MNDFELTVPDLYYGPVTCTVSVSISITVAIKFTLTERIGSQPNLSVKCSVTTGTMLTLMGKLYLPKAIAVILQFKSWL